ncbi:MAG: amidohydrolase family protein [Elusimicrobiota bacterium]|nr:amidohydrolase family protein [Elusimicrobiota bacterium]
MSDASLKRHTDVHCHVAALPTKENGCLLSKRMRHSPLARLISFWQDLPMDDPETANARYLDTLSKTLESSDRVARAVVLAMDGAYGQDGRLDEKHTDFLISNDFVLDACARRPHMLPGASINPMRRDALDELERVAERGAVLIKLLPNAQVFDPAAPAHRKFWRRMGELGLPLLSHIGFEFSLIGQDQSVGEPDRLEHALGEGATVIAAHGCSRGLVLGEPHFETMRGLAAKYPRFFMDSSALTLPNRFGMLLKLRSAPELAGRLLFGTDYPLPVFAFPSLFGKEPGAYSRVQAASNPFDRQVLTQEALGLGPTRDFLDILSWKPGER